MKKRNIIALICLIGLNGCGNMQISDFTKAEPTFVLEQYFAGKTRGWGIFEDRFGRLRRQFAVDITGKVSGDILTLDEQFKYADGEHDRRIWTIAKLAPNSYEGRADDIIGVARGETSGNAFNWSYTMDLKVGDGNFRVQFDDWMFLQPDGVLINRARVKKLGIEIGQVTVFFKKPEQRVRIGDNFSLNVFRPANEHSIAVTQ